MRDKKIVIVINDNKGRCMLVGYQKVVNPSEERTLLNETFLVAQEREQRIYELERKVKKLELDMKLDRGEISREDYEREVAKLWETRNHTLSYSQFY